jgi:hypothetical protein
VKEARFGDDVFCYFFVESAVGSYVMLMLIYALVVAGM